MRQGLPLGFRPLLLRRAQRRVGEARNRREHGQVRALRLPGLELAAEEEGQTGSAEALCPKCSLHEREDRVVDARIGQPDDPLDVVVAASDPEIPDRDSAGPDRCRLVVVESQRLGVRIDQRAQPRAREKPAGRRRVDDQGQERGEDQQQEQSPRVSSPLRELLLEAAFQARQCGQKIEGHRSTTGGCPALVDPGPRAGELHVDRGTPPRNARPRPPSSRRSTPRRRTRSCGSDTAGRTRAPRRRAREAECRPAPGSTGGRRSA